MSIRKWHRCSAFVLIAYLALHLSNHLAALSGPAAHIAFMDAIRPVYRSMLIEPLLLLCVLFQSGSGLWMVLRGWRERSGKLAWLQAGSGAYLAAFMLFHGGAVLFGRAVLHLDTNFWYAAAGFTVKPYEYFFVPYYFVAVVCLFVHLGCALYWQCEQRPALVRALALVLPAAAGLAVALAITLAFDGRLYHFAVPPAYLAIFQ